jgi:hypothetical protein
LSVTLQDKSQYFQLVATVAKSHVLAYGCRSLATTVQVQVVYPQLLASWQLSVGISDGVAKSQASQLTISQNPDTVDTTQS